MSALGKLRSRYHWYTDPLPLNEFDSYDDYWATRVAGDEPPVRTRWVVGADHIADGSTVLDVGCGPGAFLDYLRGRRPGCTLTGVDVSPAAVEMARGHGIDASVLDPTTTALGGPYDYVTCFEMIEHVHEAERALVHMRDAFTEQLIMSLPNFGYVENRVRLGVFGRFPNTAIQQHAKEHIRHWTTRDYRDWVAHFGLKVVDVLGQGGPRGTPWQRFPAVFCPQVVYVIEHA